MMSENSDEVGIDMGDIKVDEMNRVLEIETRVGLVAIVVGSLMPVALTCSTSAWPVVYCVEMLGIIFISVAIPLRFLQLHASLLMAKMAAIAAALAIIVSLASHLPPFLALTLGPFALLLVSLSLLHA